MHSSFYVTRKLINAANNRKQLVPWNCRLLVRKNVSKQLTLVLDDRGGCAVGVLPPRPGLRVQCYTLVGVAAPWRRDVPSWCQGLDDPFRFLGWWCRLRRRVFPLGPSSSFLCPVSHWKIFIIKVRHNEFVLLIYRMSHLRCIGSLLLNYQINVSD